MFPSRIHNLSFTLLLFLSILLGGCGLRSTPQDQAGEIKISLQITSSQPIVGEDELVFHLEDQSGSSILGAELRARGDMSHAGMEPVLGASVEVGDGSYSIPFRWSMAGSWVVTLEGTLPDGREILRTFDVEISHLPD
jgi:hypothetical protein